MSKDATPASRPPSKPPRVIIERTRVFAATHTPGRCVQSTRAAAIYDAPTLRTIGSGIDAPPRPLSCAGMPQCREMCRRICEHAEQRALDQAIGALAGARGPDRPRGPFDLLIAHAPSPGSLLVSGPPDCVSCGKRILGTGLVRGVWLFEAMVGIGESHVGGVWRYYEALRFHQLSLATGGCDP